MLRLVWTLDVRHLVAHRLRLVLSALGIAAGVSLAVAVSALGSSIEASLRGIAAAAATRANVEVRPATGAGMPQGIVLEVRTVQGVKAAGGVVETFTKVRKGERTRRTLVLGIDAGILELAPDAIEPTTFRGGANPFGLFVPASLADELGARKGDKIDLATPRGWREVDVGAIVPDDEAGRSRAVVGAIAVVQNLVGRAGRVDAVYVEADDPSAVAPRIRKVVGDRARVGDLALRSEDLRQLLAATTTGLGVAALVALFVGAFLVYNTMAMAAVERLGEAAVLRAVGARRRQVFALFLAEGAVLGAIGSLVGIAGGALLARGLLGSRGASFEEIFPIEVTDLVLDPVGLVVAGLTGVAAAVAAAYLPARRVARADPAPALGPAGTLEDPTERPRRATTVVGATLTAAGFAIAVTGLGRNSTGLASTGLTVGLAGIALGIRTVVPALARVVFQPMAGRGSGVGRLAAGEVLRSPGRTAFTAGAVLLALSLFCGFTISLTSFSRAFRVGVERILAADLFVRSATWRPFGSDVPLDARTAAEIRRVPGVAAVYPFRITTATVDGRFVVVEAFDLAQYVRLPGLDEEYRRINATLAPKLQQPDTVALSPSAVSSLGVDVGGTVTMPTPTGNRKLRVVGVIEDPSAVNPTLNLDFAQFSRLWGTFAADSFGVGVEPGADALAVRKEIDARLGERLGVVVDTQRQFLDRVNGLVDSIVGLIGSVQLVAMIVAGLGLANTLLISTLERRRDLGVLRAVGMLRRQVRRMVTVEALLVGGLGVVLAFGLGTAIGLLMFRVTEAQTGVDMRLVLPWQAYVIPAVFGLAGAALAAAYPAHRASRVDVVEALQYE